MLNKYPWQRLKAQSIWPVSTLTLLRWTMASKRQVALSAPNQLVRKDGRCAQLQTYLADWQRLQKWRHSYA